MKPNPKRSVLIVCAGNSCRSQMAEALWRHLSGEHWRVASAGIKPAGYVHPYAIAALHDGDVPTNDLYCKSLDAFADRQFDFVITVSDLGPNVSPIWPSTARHLSWPFPDPAKPNPKDESLAEFLAIRNSIRGRIENFLNSPEAAQPARLAAVGGPPFDDLAARTAESLAFQALAEDLQGQTDITSMALVSEAATGQAQFVSRSVGVVCGLPVCQLIVSRFGEGVRLEMNNHDGESVYPGSIGATIAGSARSILLLERTCLNFLGRLSGIATLTAQFVEACRGTGCAVYDTRKTTPGWRALEKYAVRCGGGQNHRQGLFDGVLIKDNHLVLCGQLPEGKKLSVDQAVRQTRKWLKQHGPPGADSIQVEVEVDSLEQLQLALTAVPDIILLDNMPLDSLRQSVEWRDRLAPTVLLEASGGIRLETAAAIAQSGVDRISVGALTHSAVNFDIGLDWIRGP